MENVNQKLSEKISMALRKANLVDSARLSQLSLKLAEGQLKEADWIAALSKKDSGSVKINEAQ